jgi:hypothetical protein
MGVKRKRPGCSVLVDALSTTRSESMTSHPVVRTTVLICSLVIMLMLQGCIAGPSLYRVSFNNYSDAIRKTADGQMLANLVRMRYYESPVFLQVASISTNFTVNGDVGASATLDKSAFDSYGFNAGAGYSESPTITFSLPESREYFGRLMAPLSANQITQMIDAGFDSEAVMRTAVRKINGLRNLTIDHSAYPQKPRSYDAFREALTLMKRLNSEGLAEIAPGSGFALWSSPVGPIDFDPLSQVAMIASQVLAQKTAGGDIIKNEKGEWELHIFARRMTLRFSPAANRSPDAQRLKKLLQLELDRNAFPILTSEFTATEKGRAYVGKSPASLDPKAIWTEIGLQGRSMMEIMQITSTAVQVPAEDIEEGVTFVDPSPTSDPGDAMLVIKSSKREPSNATLRIKYRGHWFYIEDNDLQSRASFALVTALFAVTGGTVPGANPILTLPVGR